MDKDIYILISKHLGGYCSREEEKALKEWLLKSEENQLYFEEISSLWNKTSISDNYSNKEAVFDKVLNEIQVDEHETLHYYSSTSGWYKKVSVVGASIIILIAASVSIYFYFPGSAEPAHVRAKWIEKANPAGQKSKIHLPDGTIAYLNSSSTLRYTSDFSDSARDIYLEGEAYFEVKKDPGRPFTVHCKDISVTALGTVFNVNSFSSEASSVVSLLEGKVSVNADEYYEILTPGQSILLQKKSHRLSKFETDVESITSWKDGILLFRGDSLNEMVKKLERWYGVTIKIRGNPDKDMKYNGEFDNEYLSNVLESMQYGRNFTFTIDGNNVTLMFN